MKILALIPARGGSKGIPGKNIKNLGGKPLIAYSIEQALKSGVFSITVVSTDDKKIAETAVKFGAEVPFIRPGSLAEDQTPTLPVVVHTLEYFSERNMHFDAVCLLQPTSPCRPVSFIRQAIDKFIQTGADALVSVRKVPNEYNPHWVFEPGKNGFLHIATGEKEIIPRRQELPPAYIRDGNIYITKTDVILNENSLYGNKLTYLVTPEHIPFINLDTPEDWAQAEQIFKNNPNLCVE
jgi:N-acylneuraminate cytidylyltransferase